jgi:SnoaL-like protein
VSTPEPDAFAEKWSAAWNQRDVEAVLTHFHDDVVFTSPFAAEIVPDSAGVVHGKPVLREYWIAALALALRRPHSNKLPQCRFRRGVRPEAGDAAVR